MSDEALLQRMAYAIEQGFILVQMSPRRCGVARLLAYGMKHSTAAGDFTYMTSEMVFGPASTEECWEFLGENSKPLPEALCVG